MPDILSVSMQDILHSWKSDLRTEEIRDELKSNARGSGFGGRCFLLHRKILRGGGA